MVIPDQLAELSKWIEYLSANHADKSRQIAAIHKVANRMVARRKNKKPA